MDERDLGGDKLRRRYIWVPIKFPGGMKDLVSFRVPPPGSSNWLADNETHETREHRIMQKKKPVFEHIQRSAWALMG